jgi:hypothetical protein
MKDKIFVQIASYRDPELPNTLNSLIENAKWPENLVFSITHQFHPEDDISALDMYRNDPRFKWIDVDCRDSLGCCWARNLLQGQYAGEEWTLQLDSHHRFEKDWDETLIRMWNHLHLSGVKKPLITTYLPAYDPLNDPQGRATTPYKMDNPHFTPEGVVLFKSSYVSLFKELHTAQPTYWYSAHFAFAKGDFVLEVPHDPRLFFHAEEISIAARAYTWGYDMFYPHILIAYHEYTRKHRVKFWDDDKDWWKLDQASKKHYNYLMGQDTPHQPIDWTKYGWGPHRTLADYEKATGINFKNRTINPIINTI